MIESIWLIKMLLSHLMTDFILQPKSWINSRNEKHFASGKLYLHGFVTGILAWVIIGWQYWLTVIVIMVTHTLIDGWKSYQKTTISFFLLDQLLHLLIILGCWYAVFFNWGHLFLTPIHILSLISKFSFLV